MKEHKKCPVCEAVALRKIGERRLELIEPPGDIQQGGGNAILKCVLGSDSHTTETLLCRKCRHLFLSPTFEDKELTLLYSPGCLAETKRQYRESERRSGQSWVEQNSIKSADTGTLMNITRKYRPKRLYDLVSRNTPSVMIKKILDFGAQTGDLTEYFSEHSKRYVYDKDLTAITDDKVIPLTSFDALKSNGPYDLIIMSHLLEHVPFPLELLNELRESLSDDGLLYVEVPLEYCGTVVKRKGVPIGPHVNYFCRSSMLSCLRGAGFGHIMIRREIVPYGECQLPAIKTIARKSQRGLEWAVRWPWFVDLFVDMILIFRVRKWPKRFG